MILVNYISLRGPREENKGSCTYAWESGEHRI